MTTTRIAAASVMLALSATATQAIEGGFQSGPSPGSFYTGGMTYIHNQNRALLTGSHYNANIKPHDGSNNDLMQGTAQDEASSCFLAKMDFDQAKSGDTYHTLSDWVSYGNPGAIETCSAVAATKSSDVYVVGSVAKGGLFSDGYPMQGLLSILDKESLGFIDATLIKSAADPNTHMIYPLDVIHDQGRRHIYIAALTSTDAVRNDIAGDTKEPNWQTQHLLGSSYDVTVIKIHAPFGEKPEALWVQHFPLQPEADGTIPPVFVAGMALQRDTNGIQHLLISGSTRGSGEAFGKAALNSKDEDGFIMQLKLSDGTFIQHDRHKGEYFDYKDDLREGTGADDFIRGMCNGRGMKEDQETDTFYIVGGTKGDMTTNDQGVQNSEDNAGFQFGVAIENKYKEKWHRGASLMPFLRKVRIQDLKPVWTTQWAAMPDKAAVNASSERVKTHAFTMDCYVDNDAKAVYVVGSVMKGAMMSQGDVEMLNQGGDDIWVAKVDEETGNVFWLTQLGSMDNEKLARHGSISVNNEGNVLIYGDTNGSMYRGRGPNEDPSTTDMFLMTIDGKTGAVMDNYYLGGTSSASVAVDINGVPPVVTSAPKKTQPPVPPKPDIVDNVDEDEDDGNVDDDATDVDTSHLEPGKPQFDRPTGPAKPQLDRPTGQATTGLNNNNNNIVQEDKKSKAGLAVGIIAVVLIALGVIYFFCNRKMKKKKAEAQKSSIFACLQQFDVEDIDLRRSPPGGWHGTYMNKLAYGHNNVDDDLALDSGPATPSPSKGEGAPLTHSSVANDALFMDGDTSGSYRDNNNDFQIDDVDEVDVRLGDNKIV